jgi:Raf kinase inhibitor-like YbhB/YbcL family protein
MYNPDVPTPSAFWHWTVAEIPAYTNELPTGAGDDTGNSLQAGVRHSQRRGPSPPPLVTGPYHYYFAVTAVDVPAVDLSDTATPALLTFNLVEHTLARALIVPIDEAMNP